MTKGLTRLACMWCKDPDFLRWMEHLSEQPCTPKDAKEFIYVVCQIESRKQLDQDTVAAALFSLHIRANFMAWRQSQVQEA